MRNTFLILMATLGVLLTGNLNVQSAVSQDEDSVQANDDRPQKGPGARPGPRQGKPGGGTDRNPLAMMFERLDQNDDGTITADEVPSRLQSRLEKLDLNSDGSITKEEVRTAIKKRAEQLQGQGGKPGANQPGARGKGKGPGAGQGKGPGKGPGKGMGKGDGMPEKRPDPAMMIKRLDKDGDGLISKEEAPERMGDRFEKLDTNGDSFLDAEELKQLGKAMKEGAGGMFSTNPDRTRGQHPKRPPNR